METQHSDWLRRLVSDGKAGPTLPSITRGEPYSVSFSLPWDASNDTFTAALRIAPDAADPPIASFTATPGSYVSGATTLVLSLNQAAIDALPADGDANGLEELVYSVQRTPSGGSESRLFAGNVFISGEV